MVRCIIGILVGIINIFISYNYYKYNIKHNFKGFINLLPFILALCSFILIIVSILGISYIVNK